MKLNVKYWNPIVQFHMMGRLQKSDVMALEPGDLLYYVNLYDEVPGVVYSVIVTSKSKHLITMECFPIAETIPDGVIFFNKIQPHIESFAYNDAVEDSNLILYRNLVLGGHL